MRAIVIREAGGLDKLIATEVEWPRIDAGQVLVRVHATGVCHRDLLDREGKYPFMRRPIVTGHEFAGEIVEVHPSVTSWKVGERVVNLHRPPCGECEGCRAGDETLCMGSPYMFGLTVDGSYAEYVAAHAGALVRMPDVVPYDGACFLMCTAAVALRALRTHARLVAGETVVITGASGGVGIHAVQVAKILGARVIALTTSPAKVEALERAGADDVLVVKAGDFHREVLARTGGGAAVALELVGAPTFNSSLRSLRMGGRMVIVGNVTAERVEVNPGWLILRQVSVTGSSSARRQDVEDVLAWVAAGRLTPIIAGRMPLDGARAAQELLQQRGVTGRLVLLP